MMSENDSKTLGVLIEQGRHLSQEIHEIKTDVKDLKRSHYLFKGKMFGAVSVISAVIALIVALAGR